MYIVFDFKYKNVTCKPTREIYSTYLLKHKYFKKPYIY